MAAANKFSDVKTLGELIPLNQLERDKLYEIAEKSTVKDFKAGEVLFRKNGKSDQTIYLLSGTAELTTHKGVERIRAGSKRARMPLHDGSGGDCSAVAKGPTTLLMIDTELLDLLIHWSGGDSYDVEEFDAEDPGDWMTSLLQNETVEQLSPDKIQTLMSCIHPLEVKAGQVIVRQGDSDRCYYLISKGRCQVTRQDSDDAEPRELAQLSTGDAFGEEALIAQTPRSATVTMLEDGLLLRLNHDDFDEHIKHPLLDYVSYEQVLEMKKQGAEILDVRQPERFQQNGFGTNLPLADLRTQVPNLSKDKTYVVCCDDGKQSAVAGFLLRQKGFHVHVLENGLNQLASDSQDSGVVNIARAKSGANTDIEHQRLREQFAQAQTKLKALEKHHAQSQQANATLKNELTQLHKKAKQALMDHEAQRAKQESGLKEQIARLEEQIHNSQTELEHTRNHHNDEQHALQQQLTQRELDVDAITNHSQTLEAEITRLKSDLTQVKQQSVKGSAQEQQYQQDIAALRNELEQSKTHGAELDKTLKQTLADQDVLQRQYKLAQSDTEKQQKAIEQLRSELDTKTQQLVELEKETAAKFERSAVEFEQLLNQHSDESEAANARVAALEQQLAEQHETIETQRQRLSQTDHIGKQYDAERQQAQQRQSELERQTAQLQRQLEDVQRASQDHQQLEQQLADSQAELANARQSSEQHQQAQQQNAQRIAELEHQLQSLQSAANQQQQDAQKALESRIGELEQQLSSERRKTEQLQRNMSDTDQAHQQAVHVLQQQLTDTQTELDAKSRQLTKLEQQQTGEADRQHTELTQQLQARDTAVHAAESKAQELEQALHTTRDKLNAVLINNETLKSQSENSHKLSLDVSTLRSRLSEAEQQLSRLNTELESQRHHNTQLNDELGETKTLLEQAKRQPASTQEKRELISEEKLTQLHQTLQKETLRADSAARVRHQLEEKIEKLKNERDFARQETGAMKEKLETYISMSKAEAELNRTLEKLEAKELRTTVNEDRAGTERVTNDADLLSSAKQALADIPDEKPIIEKQLKIDDEYAVFAPQENKRRSLLSRWWLWALLIAVAAGGYAAVHFTQPQLLPWNAATTTPEAEAPAPASSRNAQQAPKVNATATPRPTAQPTPTRQPPPPELRQAEQQAKNAAKARFEDRLKLLNENSPPGAPSSEPTTAPIQTPVTMPVDEAPAPQPALEAQPEMPFPLEPMPSPATRPEAGDNDTAATTLNETLPIDDEAPAITSDSDF